MYLYILYIGACIYIYNVESFLYGPMNVLYLPSSFTLARVKQLITNKVCVTLLNFLLFSFLSLFIKTPKAQAIYARMYD